MNRSRAFLLSALLSLTVTGAFLAFSSGARARIEQGQTDPPSLLPGMADTTNSPLTQESALQATVEQLQTMLASVDADYARQIQDAQKVVSSGQKAIQTKEASIAISQAELKALQAALSQEAQSYEQQIAALQANETQLHQNLETTLAALDSAYSDLATQQAANPGSVDNGGSAYSDHEDSHEEGEHEHDDDDD